MNRRNFMRAIVVGSAALACPALATPAPVIYEMDTLISLTDNEIKGFERIWADGKVVWCSHG